MRLVNYTSFINLQNVSPVILLFLLRLKTFIVRYVTVASVACGVSIDRVIGNPIFAKMNEIRGKHVRCYGKRKEAR